VQAIIAIGVDEKMGGDPQRFFYAPLPDWFKILEEKE
jgi:hypothetical protein